MKTRPNWRGNIPRFVRGRSSTLAASFRLSFGRIVAGIVSSVWIIIAARHFDKNEFATVILVLAFSALTSVLHDGGQCFLLTKNVTLKPELRSELFRKTLGRRLLLGSIGYLLAFGAYDLTSSANNVTFLAIGPSVFATIVYTTVFSVHRAEGRVQMEARNEVISRLVLLLLGSLALLGGVGPLGVLAVYSLIDVVSALIVSGRNTSLFVGSVGQISDAVRELSDSTRVNIVVGISAAIGVVLARVDAVLTSIFSSEMEVANFAVGSRVLDFAIIPIGVFVAMHVPRLTASDGSDEVFKITKLLIAYGFAALVGLQLIAGYIPDAFGSQYTSAVPAFRILTLSLIPYATGAVLLSWFTIHRPSRALITVSVGLAANVLVHSAITATYGAKGAAVANVVSYTTISLSAVAMYRFGRSKRNGP